MLYGKVYFVNTVDFVYLGWKTFFLSGMLHYINNQLYLFVDENGFD